MTHSLTCIERVVSRYKNLWPKITEYALKFIKYRKCFTLYCCIMKQFVFACSLTQKEQKQNNLTDFVLYQHHHFALAPHRFLNYLWIDSIWRAALRILESRRGTWDWVEIDRKDTPLNTFAHWGEDPNHWSVKSCQENRWQPGTSEPWGDIAQKGLLLRHALYFT